MDETNFHKTADAYLESLFDLLEEQDEAAELDITFEGNVLAIFISETGKQFLLSKHTPSQQLWLASPISGGLHFSLNRQENEWELKDGRTLLVILEEEINFLTHGGFELLPDK